MALSSRGFRRRPCGICRASIPNAIRVPCRKDWEMKRAARFKTGSVVFDKRRKTWNFLRWENSKRRTRRIGTLSEYPSKSAARRAAQEIQLSQPDIAKPQAYEPLIVRNLIERYRAERMPKRADTKRAYEVWINNHIIPKWSDCLITDLEPRPVELWLESLSLAPKSKAHIRGVLRSLWEFAAWSGIVPREHRNPMELVRTSAGEGGLLFLWRRTAPVPHLRLRLTGSRWST